MTQAHICDECKKSAPLGDAMAWMRCWWEVRAMDSFGTQLLTLREKDEYQFCSWKCLQETAARLATKRPPT